MSIRTATVERKTAETSVKLILNLDGNGHGVIDSGIGFFDHMLNLMTAHGLMDLTLACDGDIDVDGHHSVEDIGITLGQAFKGHRRQEGHPPLRHVLPADGRDAGLRLT